jgi:hypothetical protein
MQQSSSFKAHHHSPRRQIPAFTLTNGDITQLQAESQYSVVASSSDKPQQKAALLNYLGNISA